MREDTPRATNAARYAVLGALFGFCFSIFAVAIDVAYRGLPFNLAGALELHSTQPLIWIIDTAPLFLGLFAFLAGIRQDQVTAMASTAERPREKSAFVADNIPRVVSHVDSTGGRGLILGVDRDIGESRQAEEAHRREAEYLRALQDITLGLVSHLNVKDLIEAIVARAAALVGAEHGFVYLREPGASEMEMRVGIGVCADLVGSRIQPGTGLSGIVWETGQPLVMNDYRTWLGSSSDPRRDLMHAVVGVPLKSGDQVIGVIGLVYLEEGRQFGPAELDALSRFTTLASLAWNNANLFQQTQDALTWQQALYRASEMVGKATTLEDIVRGAAELMPSLKMYACTIGVITELDPEGEPVRANLYTVTFKNNEFSLLPPAIGRPIAGWLPRDPAYYSEFRVTVFPDLKDLSTTVPSNYLRSSAAIGFMLRMGMQGAVTLGLGAHGRKLGYLIFCDTGPLTRPPEEYAERLKNIVDLVSMAVDTQQLLQQTQEALAWQQALYRAGDVIAKATKFEDIVSGAAELVPSLEMTDCFLNLITKEDPNGLPIEGDNYGISFKNDEFIMPSPRLGAPIPNWLPGAQDPSALQRVTVFPDLEDAATTVPKGVHLPVGALASLRSADMRSMMSVGLRARGRALGYLTYSGQRRLTRSPKYYVQCLRSIADQVATAVDSLQLFRQTQRELAERQRAERFLDSVVENLPITLFAKEAQGLRYVRWNRAGEELVGFSREEMLGKNDYDFFTTQDHEVLTDRKLVDIPEEVVQTRDKGLRIFHTRKLPILDEADNPQYLLGIAEDITERKQMDEALAQARDQAMTASRLKSEFLATMSHEIRTPMNSIIGMSEMLLGTALDDQQREFATIIDQSGQALLSLVDDILDFSKIEAGKLSLENIDFDVSMTIEGTAEILAVKAREKQLALMTYVSPDIPRWLRGDPGRLRQVLINLIGNAVKFTHQGEIVVRVELGHKSDAGVTVHFAISDTGIGLSAEARQRLFQAFTQADGSTTRKYGGTGLGLAISKRLVEMMGGAIGVESEVGHGSTFWFTARFENASIVTPVKADVRGLRVLVVDDIKSHRTIVQNYLSSWGMHAQGVANGDEALQTLQGAVTRKEPYALAIIDLRMPDMDGFMLARAIKEELALASTRLILLTGFDEKGQGEEALKAGFSAYLTKPVRQSYLFDTITNVLNIGHPATQQKSPKLEAHAPSPQLATGPLSAKCILLAEDNPINRKVAVLQLSKLGFTAQTVTNGLEALEAASNGGGAYALVLMDCQMPEMDGFDAARGIRKAELTSGRHIPIVAMTANAMEGDRERCLAAGMDDYISKPVSLEYLDKVLHLWIPEEKEIK